MKIFSSSSCCCCSCSSSSSSPQTQFPPPPALIPPSLNPNTSKFHFKILPIKALLQSSSPRVLLFKIPSATYYYYNNISKESAAVVSAGLEEKLLFVDSGGDEEQEQEQEQEQQEQDEQEQEQEEEETMKKKRLLLLPTVRRPKTSSGGDDETTTKDISSSAMIDARLSEFAKKMPIFEPARVQLTDTNQKQPLGINLELALYRAKVLGRNYQFEEAKQILQKCLQFWPEDGRLYVALGKIFSKQLKTDEARSVYERGCQATQGENPYIWQCWAVLEDKMGNIRRARELFDAATAADKKHIAAWHGWAVLELKQGNIKKARNLLGKGLRYSGGNEYVYQTLALLEAKANRVEQARYLFKQATKCNPKSCASWLAWAQLEMQQENHRAARQLFERAIQASPKNRFAWHVWGMFEASLGDTEKGRKLFKIGHALNPRDPVLLQSLALLEYKYSTANLARVLFRRASELDPRHQPVWIAWGWMEWKEGNISTARELYQRALSIDSTTESAARCLQAWGVLEQRIGNLYAARRLFRSSLNVNSQSYVTWMTWASLEEEQGNSVRAEEIRDLYFQQRTEVVDDASWVMGFLDIIDPTLEKIKRLLNFNQNSEQKSLGNMDDTNNKGINNEEWARTSSSLYNGNYNKEGREIKCDDSWSNFDLDTFMKEKLSLNASKLEIQMETFKSMESRKFTNSRSAWTHRNKSTVTTTIPQPWSTKV